MAVVICTDSVSHRERGNFWQRALSDQFKVDYAIEADPASFRQSLSIRQLGPLSIMEQEGTPFSAARRSVGRDCLVTVVIPLEGQGTVRLGNSAIPMEVGTFCAYHSCKVTGLTYQSACRHLVLTVPSIHLTDLSRDWECETLLTLPANEGVGGMFVELVHSLALHEECLSESCRQSAVNLTLSLLTSAVRARGEAAESSATRMQAYHRERIRNLALSRLHDPDLDIAQLAAAVGLSVRYIHLLFASGGQSVPTLPLMQWIYDERLKRCHRDLTNPDKNRCSISEIAYAWGFNSPAHFSRIFQKRFGITPSQLRAQAKSST